MSDASLALFLSSLGPEMAWHALSKVILVSKVKKEVKNLPGLETCQTCLKPFFGHRLGSLLPYVPSPASL